ncbi:MAG: tetratricopeptide repeat protein [Gemmatimonadota bacterium]|nr:tetratricopeptide repeat protein [Gemmatimonadota bacterium]
MRLPRSIGPGPLAFLGFAVISLVAGTYGARQLALEAGCGGAITGGTEEGWERYRAGDMSGAREIFESAASCPPHQLDAAVGMGYVALRDQRIEEARRWIDRALGQEPDNVDALFALGLIHWRESEPHEARDAFERTLELDPDHEEASGYLARIGRVPGPPPYRRPLMRPDTLVYPARASGDRFEIRTPSGWEPFYWKGVNLGAALPGRHPSQFPDSTVYAAWLRGMADMGANVVRTYTIHPPEFYSALADFNAERPTAPIWLVHGVWAELPPGDDYTDTEWENDFFSEMRAVVDLLHGRADIPLRPGHAGGYYTADVSRWTLAFIIGREWEPHSVEAFNERKPELSGWEGRFLRLAGGNPMDAWLAKACEAMVAYESDVYGAQHPIAYTNWPTLDPLEHPTETTVVEEVAIRRALGERVTDPPREYDNDGVSLDASLVTATREFPAGYFASYHAYPYYPDFMAFQPEYLEASSPFGPSNYFGYLLELKAHHVGMPVVISEYGVPASLGIAHFQPQGWHHGGHTEDAMAEIDARMTLEIAAAGMAGGAVFAWIDEWFKKNWLVIDLEIPLDRNRMWLNRLDAEQHYGMIAVEPAEILPGRDLAQRLGAWEDVPSAYDRREGAGLRVTADAAYVWLLVEMSAREPEAEIFVGFDVLRPHAGDSRWPGPGAPGSPVPLDFVLSVSGGEARLVADETANPFLVVPVGAGSMRSSGTRSPLWDGLDRSPRPTPGLFEGRLGVRYNPSLGEASEQDGSYQPLRVIPNRRRFTRDSTEYTAVGYEWGVLRAGPPPDGLWERSPDGRFVEVRIPWTLLGVTDPSQRRALRGATRVESRSGGTVVEFTTDTLDGMGILLAVRHADGQWSSFPSDGSAESVHQFTWATWEQPEWRARPRPVVAAMRAAFDALNGPLVSRTAASRDLRPTRKDDR